MGIYLYTIFLKKVVKTDKIIIYLKNNMKRRCNMTKSTFLKLSSVLISVSVFTAFMTACQSGKIDETKDSIENKNYKEFIEKADEYLNNCGFQGSILLAKDGEIVLAKGYGFSDKEKTIPNTMNTTYEIGSITKQFTAAAILQLQEQGKLSVNDTLDKYFKDFENGKKITIQNLLRMRSGLYDYINDPSKFFPQEAADEYLEKSERNEDVDRDFVEKYLNSAPLKEEPGTNYYYCNTNYYLLGKIVEQLSGMTYEDYIKEKIFVPCDMTKSNTDFRATDAKGYDVTGKSLSITPNIAMGCGDINSNVIDVFKWNKALTGKKVISEKSFTEMTTGDPTYCYGVIADENSMIHGGSTYVFNSYNVVYLKKNVMLTVLINKPIEKSSSGSIAGNINRLFNGEEI